MIRAARQPYPLARRGGLLVRQFERETVVYDLERHKCHWLNFTATLVWAAADGFTAADAIASGVGTEVGRAVDEEFVAYALRKLDRAGLLLKKAARTPARATRREVADRLGIARSSSLLPVVVSMVVPTAEEAHFSRFPRTHGS
jgi:hypothetical protein